MTADLTCDEVRELAAPFVLGALEPDEEAAVRGHLATCAEPHPEFAELGSVVPALAEAVEPVEPPPAVRDRLMAAAAADLHARPATPTVRPAASEPAGAPTPMRPVAAPTPLPAAGERRPRADARRIRSATTWLLRAAAVLAIVVLAGWNLLLQGRLGESEAYARDVAAVLDVAARPGAMTAVLAPQTEGGPRGLAALDPSGTLTLAVRGLGPTTGSQVYEAWAIAGDAAPRPLGGFTVGAAGTGRLDGTGVAFETGLAVALTLEPAPGATAPSSQPVAVGTMTAPPGGEGARSMQLAHAPERSGGSLQRAPAMVQE